MNGAGGVYEEYTPWAPWLAVVVWGSMAFAAVAVLVTEDLSPGARMPTAVGILAFSGAFQWFLAGLRVRLYRDHLQVCLGRSSLIGTRISYGEIVATEVVTYAPLREFGGWGIRGTKEKVTHLVGTNPMDSLAEKPVNYLGELDSDTSDIEDVTGSFITIDSGP